MDLRWREHHAGPTDDLVIVLAAATGAVGIVALLVATLGWVGLLLAAFGIVAVSGVYRLWIQPWQYRWAPPMMRSAAPVSLRCSPP